MLIRNPVTNSHIISASGSVYAFSESVGYMQLKLDSGALHLVNILILPEFQNLGIGTEVIKNLITESEKDGRVLKLGVFKINERARKLYESLGFKTYGETHLEPGSDQNQNLL
jgi:ribosomal protein S18 acetylase RimI-like enzyme